MSSRRSPARAPRQRGVPTTPARRDPGRPDRSGAARGLARGDRVALYLLFSASGFAGLIYESIWTHYLKLFLGHAAYAQALVLAIFMGGMAGGSWLASRRSGGWRRVLLAYALCEAVIGAFALVFHAEFRAATALAYEVVLPRLAGHAAAVAAFKWTLSALLILPQCVLLGMTFPLMTAGVLRAAPEGPGRSLAMLYFTNSLGAAIGVLASGFVLVRAVGLPGTVCVAGGLNLVVAAEVWRRFRGAAPARGAGVESPRQLDRGFLALLGVALVTGASSFVYEVAWIRMLSLVLGASTHAFELMLSAFILGLALGGLVIQRRIDAVASPLRTLALVQVAMGLAALATLPVYGLTFDAMRALVTGLPRTGEGYALFNLASNGLALAVMLPATFCAGMTLPIITLALLRRGHGERSVGAVYAANTIGAIAGVFFATYAGMPLLGVKGLLTSGAALDLALGLALAWRARADFRSSRVPAALAAAAAAGVALGLVRLDENKLASGVYRTGTLVEPPDRVLRHRDGKTATVSLIANATNGQTRILTNGKSEAAVTIVPGHPASFDEATMVLLGAVPMALHPQARTAAVVGLGSGVTTHTLLSNPRLRSVDTIEIEDEIVEAARAFRPRNERAFGDPRGRVHVDDAKSWLSTAGRRYDLVVSEPSNPWVSGVAGLFSDEFYRHVRRHLGPDGLFAQWLQLYEIEPDLVVSVLKAIERNFGSYVVYAANDADAIVVASASGSVGAPDPEILALEPLARDLRASGIAGVQDLELRRVGDSRSWQGLTASFAIPANSDYHPVLDQGAARARFLRSSARGLLQFARDPFPLVDLLSPGPERRGPTAVTLALGFGPTGRARTATALRDYLLPGASGPAADALPPPLRAPAEPLARWLRTCAATPAAMPLDSFIFVALLTLPDLSRAELADLWRPVVSGECSRALSARERAWVSFVAALGARDGAAIARTSRVMLSNEVGLPQDAVRYLAVSAMAGSIASGRPEDALQLWSRFDGKVDLEQDLLARTLVTRARAEVVEASARRPGSAAAR